MSALSESELQETARNYQDLLVPALFQPWSDQFAASAHLNPDDRVLDVACGTGVLANAVAQHIGANGSVTGLDLNPGMLAVAREDSGEIEWREGNAEALPFDDESFDVVMCQFGLMLFEAPEKALREMWRVLRPGGRLLVAVFNGLDHIPAYAAVTDAYQDVVGPDVANALRFPFSMGDAGELKRLFERAGIANPGVSTHHAAARFDNARHMVLADVKGWFPFAGIDLDDQTIERVERAVEARMADYTGPDGALRFEISVHLIEVSK